MVKEEDLIRIRWHVNRDADPPLYMLICLHQIGRAHV